MSIVPASQEIIVCLNLRRFLKYRFGHCHVFTIFLLLNFLLNGSSDSVLSHYKLLIKNKIILIVIFFISKNQLRFQMFTSKLCCSISNVIFWIYQLHQKLQTSHRYEFINILIITFIKLWKYFKSSQIDSIRFDYNFRLQTDKSQEIASEITMFTTTNYSVPRSQSSNCYGGPSSPKFNFTALSNQPINESVEFNYPNSSSLKREKKMSRQEMEEMKRDVESLQNKMKSIIKEDPVGNANSNYSSLENSNINLFDENFKKSQFLQTSNATTFFPTVSLKSSILASKIVDKQTTFQERNVFQAQSIHDITSFHKLVSRGTLGTSHSINTQKNLTQSINKQSYQHFDREIGYEKQIMDLKSKITTIQFEKGNLQRTLDRTEKRLENRDQQIIKMKQRMFLLEEAKHQIDEKEKNWKQMISKLEKELVQAKIFKNDPNFQAIFQNKASETNTIRQQLRKRKQQVEHLEERVKQDEKKFEKMINGFNSERLELITKVKQTERRTSTLIFQKDQEIAILKQELQNFKYSQSRNSKVNQNQGEREPLRERIYNC